MTKEEIQKQIKVMKDYLRMNLDRDDFHACWDAAIDLQRLHDKLENNRIDQTTKLHDKLENNRIDQTTKNVCPNCLCDHAFCRNCGFKK